MRLTLDRAALLAALVRCKPAIDPKSAMPVLAHVHLAAADGRLAFAATDLVLAVTTSAPAAVATPGAVCLPLDGLLAAAKSAPAGPIELTVDAAQRATLKAGRRKFELAGIAGADYPALPVVPSKKSTTLPAGALLAALRRVAHARSTDTARPHLCGTYVELKADTLRAVATDGYRLALHELPGPAGALSVSIPTRTADAMADALAGLDDGAACALAATSARVALTAGDTTIGGPLCTDAFPAWHQVVPVTHDRTATFDRAALCDALAAVLAVAGEDGAGLARFGFAADGVLVVDRADADGSREARAELEGAMEGGALVIGLCVRYVLEAARASAAARVALELSGELDPLVLRGAGEPGAEVVMPGRI